MTIEEVIRHCEEVAEQKEHESFIDRWSDDDEWSESVKEECHQCAADHRQLAEWLMELKELREQNFKLKSTLSAALKDINGKNICEIMNVCKLCAMKFQQLCDVFPWQYTNEVLKLIGEDGDTK